MLNSWLWVMNDYVWYVVTEWLQRFLELAQFLEACPCSGSVHLPSSTRASKYFSTVALSNIISVWQHCTNRPTKPTSFSKNCWSQNSQCFNMSCVRCIIWHIPWMVHFDVLLIKRIRGSNPINLRWKVDTSRVKIMQKHHFDTICLTDVNWLTRI